MSCTDVKKNWKWLFGLWVLFFLPCLIGTVGFFAISLPDFKDYLEEERFYIATACRVKYIDTSGTRHCSHKEYDEGEWDKTSENDNTYTCLQIFVTATFLNVSNKQHVEFFRSYQDARETNHECAVIECKNPEVTDNFAAEVRTKGSFTCYYHPDKLEYAYLKGGLEGFSIMCLVFLIIAILLIVIPLAFCCIDTSFQHCKKYTTFP